MLVLVFALVIVPHEQERLMAVLVDPIPNGEQICFTIACHYRHTSF